MTALVILALAGLAIYLHERVEVMRETRAERQRLADQHEASPDCAHDERMP